MRHARDGNELLEIAGNELRSVVGNDSRRRFRVLLLGSLQDYQPMRCKNGEGWATEIVKTTSSACGSA